MADCEDYRDIKINEENLAQYPSDSGDIELPFVDEADDEKDKSSKTENLGGIL